MDRKTKKKTAQQVLNAKSRHARFITEYVLRKQPRIYEEANMFYNQLKAIHPNKRDLTRTHEFLVETTNYADYRDFYNRKKVKHRKQRVTTTTTTTTQVDNMQLNIDLLTPQVVAENTHTPLRPIPDGLYQQLLAELRTDPELDTILNDMIDPKADDLDQRTDPELDTILNDMIDPEADDLDQDSEQDAMPNDLEQTPLEKELQDMGY